MEATQGNSDVRAARWWCFRCRSVRRIQQTRSLLSTAALAKLNARGPPRPSALALYARASLTERMPMTLKSEPELLVRWPYRTTLEAISDHFRSHIGPLWTGGYIGPLSKPYRTTFGAMSDHFEISGKAGCYITWFIQTTFINRKWPYIGFPFNYDSRSGTTCYTQKWFRLGLDLISKPGQELLATPQNFRLGLDLKRELMLPKKI